MNQSFLEGRFELIGFALELTGTAARGGRFFHGKRRRFFGIVYLRFGWSFSG